jgi:hypothetical protein
MKALIRHRHWKFLFVVAVGGRPETDTYVKWIDYTVRTLVHAASEAPIL